VSWNAIHSIHSILTRLFRLLSQQLSEVMAICENNIKDIKEIAKDCPEHLTLIDAIGSYRKISFDLCVSYEVRPVTVVQPASMY
jgi:hypothetical protein